MSINTGVYGYFDLLASKAGITVRVHWVETYNTVTNTSVVAISGVEAKSSKWYGISYFLKGSIAVDGTNMVTFDEDHYLYWDKMNTFTPLRVRDGATLPPWSSADIKHNEDGTKTVNITFSFTGTTVSGGAGSGWVVDEVVPVTLTNIPVPEPEPDPDTPVPEPEPEPKEPVMIFAYDGELVLFPRYEGKIVSFIIVPHGDGDEYSAMLGVGVLGKMILGNEV